MIYNREDGLSLYDKWKIQFLDIPLVSCLLWWWRCKKHRRTQQGWYCVLPPGAHNVKVIIKEPIPSVSDPFSQYITAGVKWDNGYTKR